MYELVIKDYVNKLTEQDIINYSRRKDIALTDDEVKILYLYAKNYWKEFYSGNPDYLIKELKNSLSPTAFNSLYNIYINLKNKYK